MAVAYLRESPDRPRRANLRFDAVAVLVDSQGKQWRTDAFLVPMGIPLSAAPRPTGDIEEPEH